MSTVSHHGVRSNHGALGGSGIAMPHDTEHHEQANNGDGSNDNYRQPQSLWSRTGIETVEHRGTITDRRPVQRSAQHRGKRRPTLQVVPAAPAPVTVTA